MTLRDFGRDNVVHLNDTHPALAPPELMRLLLDEHGLPWDEAWAVTREAVSYTNHTLMPEALETWPLPLFERLLPRHLEIVYEINDDFLVDVRRAFPDDEALRASRVADRRSRASAACAWRALAIVASHRVNGVSALHSELMVQTIFADFARARCRTLHQRHQRRDAAALAGAGQPGPVGAARPGTSARAGAARPRRWRRWHLRADEPAIGAAFMTAKRANKERLAARSGANSASRSTRPACSTCRSSASTSTSGSC